MYEYQLSLGANLGDRLGQLRGAIQALEQSCGSLLRCSACYETPPWGGIEQPAYYNLALSLRSDLSPLALLDACQAIELAFGRERLGHWTARTLDIDLLLCGQAEWQHPRLVLPHPWMHLRRFVLQPLAEIEPQLVHPLLQRSIAQLLDDCPDLSILQPINEPVIHI